MRADSILRATILVLSVLAGGPAFSQGKPPTQEERLFDAIDEGKELVAEGLMVRGKLDYNARNANGETALHRATEKGMKVLARALLAAGSSVRARSGTGETVLHIAALHADPVLTQMMLAAGADAKARNDEGESALHWAALSGNVAVAGLLLAAGADPNLADLKGNRPLHAAADSGSSEMVRAILEHASDPKARNREGRSAEDVARERDRPDVAELLAKASARPAQPAGGSNYGTIDIDLQPKERF